MSNRLKPIPRNQSEVTQQAINPPYLANQGKPISQTVFSENRGTDYSMRNDTVKDISIGLEDIDSAIMYYFNNVIKPSVVQNGQQIEVPVLYGSPERWKSVQADGFYRDKNGKLMVPLIMFKRETIEKDRTIGNKLDGNTAHLYQVVGTKYNARNAYDRFDIINNRIPSEQYYVTATPDYLTLTYNCIIFTDFVEQNNKLVEAVEFASDSYWGDPARYKFRAAIDSFATTTLLESGEDRAAKSTFTIKVHGYIIPNTVNKDMATARSKFYTKSQVVFTMETAGNIETLRTSGAPRTAMGAAVGVADSYNVNVTQITQSILPDNGSFLTTASFNAWTGSSTSQFAGTSSYALNALSASYATTASYALNGGGGSVDPTTLTYLNTNVNLTGTFVDNVTVKFPAGWLAAPVGLPATSVSNFMFFCNGQFVEKTAIVSFVDNLDNTSTLVIDPVLLSYDFELSDEVVAIGKFSI